MKNMTAIFFIGFFLSCDQPLWEAKEKQSRI